MVLLNPSWVWVFNMCSEKKMGVFNQNSYLVELLRLSVVQFFIWKMGRIKLLPSLAISKIVVKII